MSDKIDDGGLAFPRTGGMIDGPNTTDWVDPQSGMTLRDYFAGQYLAGSMANHQISGDENTTALWAYRFADAMLAARKVQP